MTEYCYPECTTSVITSLSMFRKHYPHYRANDIELVLPFHFVLIYYLRFVSFSRTLRLAIKYLHEAQTPDGGWLGSWGICFTYATQFATESLSLVGETYGNSTYSRKACHFLLKKQRVDGGWGESYKVHVLSRTATTILNLPQSCEQGAWVEHAESQVIQTCWAVMALMYARYPHAEPIERAVRLVMSRQRPV